MTQAEFPYDALCFTPAIEPANDTEELEIATVREVARSLALRADITAVVAANALPRLV